MNMTEFDKQVYESELLDFLPSEMIDVHTHIWKKEFERQDVSGKNLVSWTRRVAADCTAEDLMQTYKDLFPGKKVSSIVFGHPSYNLEQTNGYTEECIKRYKLPALYCTSYDMKAHELEEAVKKGGFLGLKPYVNNSPSYIPGGEIRIFDFLTHEHLKVADKNGWIVMLHIPRSQRLSDPLNVAQLMEIEEKYPNVKLIVAHVGRAYCPEDLGSAFDTLKHTKNMMFDFSANTLDTAMEECIRAVGPQRVLFGSDMPISKMRMYRITENGNYVNVVPRGLYGDVSNDSHMRESDEKNISLFIYEELLAFKRCAMKLGLTKSDIEDILCNNAKRIIGE